MTYLLCAVLFWGRKTSSVKKTAETLNTIFARDFCIFAKMNPKYKWVVIANAFDAILKSLYRPAGEKFCLNALNQQWVLHKLYITLLYLLFGYIPLISLFTLVSQSEFIFIRRKMWAPVFWRGPFSRRPITTEKFKSLQ